MKKMIVLVLLLVVATSFLASYGRKEKSNISYKVSPEMTAVKEQMKEMMKMHGMGKSGSIDYITLRETIDKASEKMPAEPGVTFTKGQLGGVPVELSAPEKLTGDNIILYIHGGGFTTGSALGSRGFASQLASEAGLRVYSLSYRLAPENPYPAAQNDCYTVYTRLLGKYPDKKIAVIGDSAGANLALVTTLKAMDDGITLPTSVTVYSPVVDLTGTIDRNKNSATDIIISADIDSEIKSYLKNNNPYDPYISPLYGNYKGFPPLKIVCDSAEVLTEDSERLAKKAKEAGVNVDLQKFEGTFHAFPITGKGTPESYKVLRDTAKFIKDHFN
ncbi:alpha/beta hydrolase [Sporomusa termitida]|uniref:Acetyl eSPTERase n=1 Tax=Sporomusa termitida TaxID=2377 RepID=A0A517DSD7_9FIRM|nr:alpha/beta hydrolase [Sporomusa termitida]QDR80275.1 Acetyl eSPTERase [Sporomusa termitida]